MATEFVRRGYAVMLPMRAGYAGSTGSYRDHGCDMAANAAGQARDVRDALAYARRQDWVDASRIVVAGQSYGGLAALSLATQALPGVRGVLNFAGGLRVDDGACDWQAALKQAFAALGAASQVPSLWLYGENDGYFAPPLVRRLYRAYAGAGGQAELFAYGAFKRDAHLTLGSRDGVDVWLAPTERFLRRIGMPAAPVVRLPEPAPPPATRFASRADIGAVPYLAETRPRRLPRLSRQAAAARVCRLVQRRLGLGRGGRKPGRCGRSTPASKAASRPVICMWSMTAWCGRRAGNKARVR